MDSRYQEMRSQIDKVFGRAVRLEDQTSISLSPTGEYQLEIATFSTGPNSWEYSRGIVTRVSDGRLLADIKRNYGHFWYCWIAHPNGKEYLLCGEDYQGYSVLNLSEERCSVHFPEEGYQGFGFCWTKVTPSPDRLVLAVFGCYWACPYGVALYDFQNPDELPLRELGHYENVEEVTGWVDNDTFLVTVEVEFRASDGRLNDTLTDAEQAVLDEDRSQVGYRIERREIRRSHLDQAT